MIGGWQFKKACYNLEIYSLELAGWWYDLMEWVIRNTEFWPDVGGIMSSLFVNHEMRHLWKGAKYEFGLANLVCKWEIWSEKNIHFSFTKKISQNWKQEDERSKPRKESREGGKSGHRQQQILNANKAFIHFAIYIL